MEGNLLKWTNLIFGWSERYFVLKGNILYYYLKKGDKPKGRFHLSVCQINVIDSENRFDIDTGLTIIYLKASNKELNDDWAKAFKAAKRDADIKLQSSQTNNFNTSNIHDTNLNQNLNNNMNFDAEYYSNRNCITQEDRLLTKANLASSTASNLLIYNKKFSEIIQLMEKNDKSKFIQDLKNLNSDYNVIFFLNLE